MSGPFGSSQWMYASGGFYDHQINQSLRFDDGDAPTLSRAFDAAQTNTKKLTISVWVKRGNLGLRSTILYAISGCIIWNKGTCFTVAQFNAININPVDISTTLVCAICLR